MFETKCHILWHILYALKSALSKHDFWYHGGVWLQTNSSKLFLPSAVAQSSFTL